MFFRSFSSCPPPVGVVVLKWLLKPQRGDDISEIECEHCLSGWAPPSPSHSLFFTVSRCLAVWTMAAWFCCEWWDVCVCELPLLPSSPTPPSPALCLHVATWWPGWASPLQVTQLWGAVLARPLSPVSEPRLMTARWWSCGLSSLPPSLPAPLPRPHQHALYFILYLLVT